MSCITPISVPTPNEKETKYFNVDKDYLPKELVEVVAIPTAEEALNDKKVKDILSKTKTFTRDDFTKILRTCHNIIRNIAMVEDAGITSTGAVSAGNQLPTLQDEYKEYRIAKKLWNEANSVVSYIINSQGRLFRTSDGKEVELKW